MDIGAAFQNMLVKAGLLLLIAVVDLTGLILGVIGVRRAGRNCNMAVIGTVLNGLGLLGVVMLVVGMIDF
jgi:hypothetical protein